MSCKMSNTRMELNFTGEAMKNAVKSFSLSKQYVQIAIRASILNILYRRIPITDTCLKTKKIEHIPFVVFKSLKKVKDPVLNMYISWMVGITDAIKRNYLSEIFIFLKRQHKVIEMYRFAIKFNMNETIENKRTFEYVNEDTKALFEMIFELEKVEKISGEFDINIELKYSDITPAEYEPPGFMAALQANCLEKSSYFLHLGTLNTGYHMLTCRAQGIKLGKRALTPNSELTPDVDENLEEVMDVDENEVEMKIPESFVSRKIVPPNKKIKVLEEIIILDDGSFQNMERNKFNTSNITISDNLDNVTVLSDMSSRNNVTVATSSGVASSSAFDCMCQLLLPMETPAVKCTKCSRLCHVPCAGFFRDIDAVGADFRCTTCDSTDTMMMTYDASDVKLLAIIRLVLFFSYKNEALPEDIIELIDEPLRERIFLKLKEFSIYTVDTKTGKSSFNRRNVERTAPSFFNTDNSQYFD